MAKVIFLHLFVILFTGGVCLSACWDTTPLGPDPPEQTPPPQGAHIPRDHTPPDQTTAPPSRHQITHHPLGPDHPPRTKPPPPLRKQTPAYGLRAASTHPTGMHSCYHCDQWMINQKRKIKTALAKYYDGTWREEFLVPLLLYNPVFTIVIY